MINLGDVNFNLGADTRSLQQSVNLMRQFGQTVNQVQTQTTQSANATAAAYRKQEAAITSALNQTLRLASTMRKVQDGEKYANQATAAFSKLNTEMTRGQLSSLQYQRAMEQFRASLGNAQRGFKEFSTASEMAAGRGQTFRTAIQGLQSSAVLIQGPLGGVATRITNIGALARTAGGAFALFVTGMAAAAYVTYKVGQQLLQTGIMMNKLQSQLEAVTGSSKLAAGEMNTLFAIARKTGQSVEDLAGGYARFEVAAKGAGLSVNEMQREFIGLSMASTKLQLSGDDTQGIFRALEQMLSKGTVQAEELRGQLGDRLPGAFNIAARAMGVTTQELNKMMKAGEVVSKDFLPKFIDELQRSLNIDPSKPIDNYAASVNNLSTAWTQLKAKLDAMTGTTKSMMDLNKETTQVIDNLTASLDQVPEAIQRVNYFWQAMSEDIMSSNKGTVDSTQAMLDAIVSSMRSTYEEMTRSTTMTWAEQLDIEAKTINKMLDLTVNMVSAIELAFKGSAQIIASYVIDMMNVMIDNIKSGMNALFAIIRDRTDSIAKVFPSMKDILPYPEDFKLGTDTIPNTMRKSWSDLGEEIAKTMTTQHGYLDGTIAKIKEWAERAKDLEYMEKAGKGPQKRGGLYRIDRNATAGGADSEVAMTDKQVKALERKQEAMKAIEDEIDRTQEKLEAMGGTEANLNSLNEQFKREKEVEKYAKALRKAGVDTAYIAQKTSELNQILLQTYQAEKAREALMELRDSFVQGFDQISDSILQAFENGENAAQAFKNAVKAAINDILDTIIKLTLLNPLKNWLFGTDLPTLGGAGSGGASNILSSVLPGIFGGKSGGGSSAASAASAIASSVSLPMNTGGSSLLQTFSSPVAANDNSLGGTMKNFASAIRFIESGSFAGNYKALGPITASGDRAYGAYQVMGANIPSWTKGALGQSMSPSQYLNNPGAQDAVFAKYFGGYAQKWGANGAANAWFTGSPRGSGSDVLGTSNDQYVQKFQSALSKLGNSASDVARPLGNVGDASANATQGLGQFGNALSQFPAAPSGGMGGWLSGLFSSGLPSMDFSGSMAFDWLSANPGDYIGLWAKGGVFSGGHPMKRFAKGDIFGSPTTFPMAGGDIGMLGEAGEEAIMPLTRGSDGRLGVASNGNASPNVNFTVIDKAGVRVTHSKRFMNDGTIDIVAVIDQTVADRLSRRGTDSNNALRSTFGARQTMKSR